MRCSFRQTSLPRGVEETTIIRVEHTASTSLGSLTHGRRIFSQGSDGSRSGWRRGRERLPEPCHPGFSSTGSGSGTGSLLRLRRKAITSARADVVFQSRKIHFHAGTAAMGAVRNRLRSSKVHVPLPTDVVVENSSHSATMPWHADDAPQGGPVRVSEFSSVVWQSRQFETKTSCPFTGSALAKRQSSAETDGWTTP